MKDQSLPVKYPDGSVIIRPLRAPADRSSRRMRTDRYKESAWSSAEEARIVRAKIFRDIVVLAVLALTIIAGSAILIGMLWRDVAIAETDVRIVELQEAAKVRIAEAEAEAIAREAEEANAERFILVLAGLALVIVLLCLARPTVIVGR